MWGKQGEIECMGRSGNEVNVTENQSDAKLIVNGKISLDWLSGLCV